VLQSSTETHTYELYKPSRSGSTVDALDFAGLITHNLVVQEAEDVTAGVDSALAQLKSSMAAISEFKEANKYASPVFPWLPKILWHRVERLEHPCPAH
jgi:RNA polymerase II elongation factor ELL